MHGHQFPSLRELPPVPYQVLAPLAGNSRPEMLMQIGFMRKIRPILKTG